MKRCRMLKGDSKTQIAHTYIWIFMNELFSCVLFFPRSAAAVSHLRLPCFFSLSMWGIGVFASKNYEQRAKEQVQLNAVHKGMRVTEFFSPFACMWVCICLSFLFFRLVYTFWCGHTFSTVAYSSSLRLLLLVIVLLCIFVHLFEYIVFRTELVFLFSYNVFFFGAFDVHLLLRLQRVLNCENVANMWSHGLVDIRIFHTKLSRQNNIYPPIKSSLFSI